MGLERGARIPKDKIEHWLRINWPDEFGSQSKRKIESMATFLRLPEDERGGYFKSDRHKYTLHDSIAERPVICWSGPILFSQMES
ncbi:MAG: hypothetical protein QF582_09650, partial [Alphaproteobacteria bacterium]|nr:hypothetical protein [Alphaproteobacteria bacterium]